MSVGCGATQTTETPVGTSAEETAGTCGTDLRTVLDASLQRGRASTLQVPAYDFPIAAEGRDDDYGLPVDRRGDRWFLSGEPIADLSAVDGAPRSLHRSWTVVDLAVPADFDAAELESMIEPYRDRWTIRLVVQPWALPQGRPRATEEVARELLGQFAECPELGRTYLGTGREGLASPLANDLFAAMNRCCGGMDEVALRELSLIRFRPRLHVALPHTRAVGTVQAWIDRARDVPMEEVDRCIASNRRSVAHCQAIARCVEDPAACAALEQHLAEHVPEGFDDARDLLCDASCSGNCGEPEATHSCTPCLDACVASVDCAKGDESACRELGEASEFEFYRGPRSFGPGTVTIALERSRETWRLVFRSERAVFDLALVLEGDACELRGAASALGEVVCAGEQAAQLVDQRERNPHHVWLVEGGMRRTVWVPRADVFEIAP
ncbi:MAG: hypothetical protein AAGE52_27305 [Myxococcota bacterium]